MPDVLDGGPFAVPLLCAPSYFPDPGHEDKLRHSEDPNCAFYGLIHGKIQGVVTSPETLDAILNNDPTAAFIEAATWPRLVQQWNIQCNDFHDHEAGVPPESPLSSPSPSPSPSPNGSPLPRHRVIVAARKPGGSILPLSPEEVGALWNGAVIVSPERQAERNAEIVHARNAARIQKLRESVRHCAKETDRNAPSRDIEQACREELPAGRNHHSNVRPRRNNTEPRGRVGTTARMTEDVLRRGLASGAVTPLLYDPLTHPWGESGRLSPISISDGEETSA
ncbi:hypothetical protein B0H15DRAFT_799788 [Mycena belliarum]|uniref:Uncharacterized protein n=1 Tax=Mycena belliarum TaxID=1033014 RepID=A0AAD6U975_9AGAR|nr:hypothetical protein B0H15DRAFT_799788 [Mycena belliae]